MDPREIMPTPLEYEQHINGSINEYELPVMIHRACCDCGLDHLFVIREEGKGKISITVYRDDMQTIKNRQKRKFDCRPKK